jgi:hypothetical protein
VKVRSTKLGQPSFEATIGLLESDTVRVFIEWEGIERFIVEDSLNSTASENLSTKNIDAFLNLPTVG